MKNKIIDAATELFSRRGYYETSMDDVAQQAGVAKGSLYYHFKTKSQLFCETALAGLQFITDRVRAITAQELPPMEIAQQTLVLFADICLDYVGMTDMIMNEMSAGIDADVLKTVRQAKWNLLDEIVAILDEGIRAQVIRPCDSRSVAAALVSFVYAYCRRAGSPAGAARESLSADICSVLLRGLLI